MKHQIEAMRKELDLRRRADEESPSRISAGHEETQKALERIRKTEADFIQAQSVMLNRAALQRPPINNKLQADAPTVDADMIAELKTKLEVEKKRASLAEETADKLLKAYKRLSRRYADEAQPLNSWQPQSATKPAEPAASPLGNVQQQTTPQRMHALAVQPPYISSATMVSAVSTEVTQLSKFPWEQVREDDPHTFLPRWNDWNNEDRIKLDDGINEVLAELPGRLWRNGDRKLSKEIRTWLEKSPKFLHDFSYQIAGKITCTPPDERRTRSQKDALVQAALPKTLNELKAAQPKAANKIEQDFQEHRAFLEEFTMQLIHAFARWKLKSY